ncbi:MAG: hypothetical protein AVO33_08870 [delta proteobacterium ML8_F1]|nr:MAG: hypothetical protein AVO33_08870 [delta proteobacterium ML8_F1]
MRCSRASLFASWFSLDNDFNNFTFDFSTFGELHKAKFWKLDVIFHDGDIVMGLFGGIRLLAILFAFKIRVSFLFLCKQYSKDQKIVKHKPAASNRFKNQFFLGFIGFEAKFSRLANHKLHLFTEHMF